MREKPRVEEVLSADRERLKRYCGYFNLSTKGKNEVLRRRLLGVLEKRKKVGREEDIPCGGNEILLFATILQNQGQHDSALSILENYEEECQSILEYWLMRGNSLLELERAEEAVECYEKALQLDETSKIAGLNRAKALIEEDHDQEALQALRSQKGEDDYSTFLLTAIVLARSGRLGRAIQYFDRALQLDPGLEEVWNAKGEVLLLLQNYGNALPCFDKAIALRPDYEAAFNNKGVALARLGNHKDAILYFNRALRLREDYPEALNNKACCLLESGEKEEALKILARTAEISPSYLLWNNEGHLHLELGEFEEARNCFDRSIAENEELPEAWYGKGFALERMGKDEEAIPCYKKAGSLHPGFVEADRSLRRLTAEREGSEAEVEDISQVNAPS